MFVLCSINGRCQTRLYTFIFFLFFGVAILSAIRNSKLANGKNILPFSRNAIRKKEIPKKTYRNEHENTKEERKNSAFHFSPCIEIIVLYHHVICA